MYQMDIFRDHRDLKEYDLLPPTKWERTHLEAWAKDNHYERELAFIRAKAQEMQNRYVPRIKEALEGGAYIFTADRMLEFLDDCDLEDDRDAWEELDFDEAVDFAVEKFGWIEWTDAQDCALYAPDYWEEATFEVCETEW